MTFYKLRHKKTGLFYRPHAFSRKWSKDGKTWTKLRDLRLHFRIQQPHPSYDPKDVEVVEYTVVESAKYPIINWNVSTGV